MLHSGMQKKFNDLFVTAKWWIKTPELHRLSKRCDDNVIPDNKDPLGVNFVMTAAWLLLKIKNLCIPQIELYPFHPHIEQCRSFLVCL